jgi:hypothetical protein
MYMAKNENNERYGEGEHTFIEKALGVAAVMAAGLLLFELSRSGYLGGELQVFTTNIAIGINQMADAIGDGFSFLHGDMQLREGVGMVELFKGASETLPDISIDKSLAKKIQQPLRELFEPIISLGK